VAAPHKIHQEPPALTMHQPTNDSRQSKVEINKNLES
jgi:hypothetical protein